MEGEVPGLFRPVDFKPEYIALRVVGGGHLFANQILPALAVGARVLTADSSHSIFRRMRH
jgi:hypothetical protein